MECNEEEAARAKFLAERKMVEKDFVGAKRMILKSQQLSKELDNISPQMLAVCDVHSAAGAKVNGEIDWYGILHVPVNADDVLIRKQYRRLAVLLHPDKNKFAGAEAAFKLVGEAKMTLTDQAKRSVYDMKRNNFVRGGVARPSRPAPTRPSATPVNLHKVHQPQQHQASNSAGPKQTFWTICPSCGMRYQYYLSILKKALCCQNCLNPFIAHDLKEQAVPSGANRQSAGVWKNAGAPQNVPPSQANVPDMAAWNSTTPGVHVNIGSHHANVNRKREADGKTAEQDKMKPARVKKNAAKASSTAGQKKGRRAVIESSVSSDSETTGDSEGIVEQGPAANSTGPGHTRRSRRHRQEVKCNAESDDDDIEADSMKDDEDDDKNVATPPSLKRLRKSGPHGDHRNETTKLNEDISGHNGPMNGVNVEDKNEDVAPCGEKTFSGTQQMKRETMQARENSDGKEKVFHSVSDNCHDPNNDDASDDSDDKFIFVDPEFFDFEQLRDGSQFRPNQIWAIYDDDGCMPRFYAQITNVKTTPNFMVHYVWLEFDPKSEMEAAWHNSGLPVACGRFKLGTSDTSKESGMFSRTIFFDKSQTRNSFEIYPRKGEVWALFKGWNISWSLDAQNHREYQYEVVQVLSDLTTSTSIIVMPLVKIKGFVSLFIQSKEAAPYVICQGETLRFSHCVPHHLMSGNEKEGIPEGSLELDTAGLPYKFEEYFPSVAPDCNSAKGQESAAFSSSVKSPYKGSMSARESQDTTCMNAEAGAKTQKGETSEHKTAPAGFTDADEDNIGDEEFVDVEEEFHKFSDDKLLQQFSTGQIWALYSDVDKFPNYYGLIHRVDLKSGKIQVRWLNACPQGKYEKRLLEEGRPIACGIFKVSGINDMMTHSVTTIFSHPVEARTTGKKYEYEINPNLGEIWAVYKNWRTGWTAQDYEECEYELVEIFGHTYSSTQVKLLRKVDGYKVVFMPCNAEGSVKTIRKDEYLKFSHQIPCFHLTREKGGKLQDCLELDPLSLPEEFLITNPKGETSKRKRAPAGFTDADEDNICDEEFVDVQEEFHKFSDDKLLQKFSAGQIWALYSDVDKLPNYYGLIHRVDLKNGKIQVRWLNVCPQGKYEKRLLLDGRPIACGAFKVSTINDMMTHSITTIFSHRVEARTTGKKYKYEINPNPGQIWAVYKNWRRGWTAQDYEKCEYDLVEIFGHTDDSSTQVKLLRKVDGYNVVFMPCVGEGSVKTIRKDEYLKFSHQIPCFHLTREKRGKLRGCLELNPLSLPEEFLTTNSK